MEVLGYSFPDNQLGKMRCAGYLLVSKRRREFPKREIQEAGDCHEMGTVLENCTGLAQSIVMAEDDCSWDCDGTKDCVVQYRLWLRLDWSKGLHRLIWMVVGTGLVDRIAFLNLGCRWDWGCYKKMFWNMRSALVQWTVLANMDCR